MDIEEAFHVTGNMGRYQVLLTSLSFLCNIPYGSQLFLMVIVGATPNKDVPSERNLTTIVTEWNLYDDQWVISLLGSLFLIGYFVGSFLFGQLPDLYGRKPVLVINSLLTYAICFSSAFCQNWHTFAVTRFLGGLFSGSADAPSYVLMCELVGKDTWGTVGMISQMFFSLGILLLGVYGYLLRKWRYVLMASCGLVALVLPFFMLLVPESPRWLYSVGKIQKAEEIMKLIARRNGKDASLIKLKYPESVDDAEDVDFQKHTVLGLVRSKPLAKSLAAVMYVWFACALAYYGLTVDVGSLMPNIYLGAVLSGAVEIPSYIIALLLLDRKWFGRKGSMMLFLLTTSITSTSLLFTNDSEHFAILETVMGLISKLSMAAGYAVMYLYISELFPAQVRTAAMIVAGTAATIGGVVATFVVLLGNIAFYIPYAIFGAVTVLAGVVMLSFPETLGRRPFVMSDFMNSSTRSRLSDTTSSSEGYQKDTRETEPLIT